MADKVHYAVIAKLIKKSTEKGGYEFQEINKEFHNETPIIARQAAFRYYQNLVEVLLQSKGFKYESDRQAVEILETFIDPKTSTTVKIKDEEIEFSNSIGNGIGVFIIFDNKVTTELEKEYRHVLSWDKSILHGIGFLMDGSASPENFIIGLEEEFNMYRKNDYDTGDFETTIVFCDSDEWLEGYREDQPQTYNILKTPFDWSGMDKPYWWGEPTEDEQQDTSEKSKSFEDIIAEGESNQVEFKPTLLYNFKTHKASIAVKGIIAKTICSFLNSQGGFLFIGVNDNGEIQGLDYDFSLAEEKQSKDFFLLEFDDMLKHFLPYQTKANISGYFNKINGKDVFIIVVYPSKSRPVFLKGQFDKEFWVRWTASSRQYKDIEEIANYCLEHWGKEK